jgi:hypothetical protein
MNREASNGASKRKNPKPRVPVTVRLPEQVVRKIDLELGQRDVPLSRNNWLLEAAIEKLRKSPSGDSNGAK